MGLRAVGGATRHRPRTTHPHADRPGAVAVTVSSSPRGEQPGRPGIRWQTELRTTEVIVDEDAPDPKPNRKTRRAQARAARRRR